MKCWNLIQISQKHAQLHSPWSLQWKGRNYNVGLKTKACSECLVTESKECGDPRDRTVTWIESIWCQGTLPWGIGDKGIFLSLLVRHVKQWGRGPGVQELVNNDQATLELSLGLGKLFPWKYPLGSPRTGTISDTVTGRSPGGLPCWDEHGPVGLWKEKSFEIQNIIHIYIYLYTHPSHSVCINKIFFFHIKPFLHTQPGLQVL